MNQAEGRRPSTCGSKAPSIQAVSSSIRRGAWVLGTLLLLGASVALAAGPRKLVFQDSALGKLRVEARPWETEDGGGVNGSLTEVRIVDAQGGVAGSAELGPVGTAEVALHTVAGFPSPLVVAVVPYARADGVDLEAAVLGVVNGKVRELFLENIQSDAENALCLGPLRGSVPPAAALVEWDLDDTCTMCWPKRFKVTRYRWAGDHFEREGRSTTRRRHKSWSSALREFGLRCLVEVLNENGDPR